MGGFQVTIDDPEMFFAYLHMKPRETKCVRK